jgi:hypothetical protein
MMKVENSYILKTNKKYNSIIGMLWKNISDDKKKSIIQSLRKSIRMSKIKKVFNVR